MEPGSRATVCMRRKEQQCRACPGCGGCQVLASHGTGLPCDRLHAAQGATMSGLSQSSGVYGSLAMVADFAASGSEVAHDPERPCGEAEAPVEGRFQRPALRSDPDPAGGLV